MDRSLHKAVFLSYASQDNDAARRICEALRAAGVEVWFDQSELRGGDAWDQKIRRQIKECALFVPIISANTQARGEGYFRLEWRLADQRTHLMAKGRPFLVPVVIDETRDSDAHVPDSFTEVQWTLLPGGETSASFGARVKTLLAGNDMVRVAPSASSAGMGQSLPATRPVRRKVPAVVWATVFAALLAVVAFVVWPRRRAPASSPASPPPAAAASQPGVSEARQLVAKARGLFFQLDETKDDFKMAEDLLKQAIAKDGSDAEAWAAYAQLQQRYAARGWDLSDERREEARTATQRALRLDPRSFEARFAQTNLATTTQRGVHEREAALRELLRERPDDQRVLRALGSLLRYDPERRQEANRIYDQSAALPGGDPLALYNKALNLWFAGRASEAEAAVRAALAQKPFVGARLMELFFAVSLRGDLERAKSLLDQVPTAELREDRGCYFAYLLHRHRGNPDAALAVVRAFSRDWIEDGWFRGPRALLAGDALAQAGRPAAAVIEWRAALKVTDTRLAANPNELGALGNRLVLLARLGETAAVRQLYPSVRQLVRADQPGVIVPVWFTDACLTLGERAEALRQIRVALASKIHATYFTAADLRNDPTWAMLRDDPEFVRLIAEAERVEKADDVVTPASEPKK